MDRLDALADLLEILLRPVVSGVDPVAAIAPVQVVDIAVRGDFASRFEHPLDEIGAVLFRHLADHVESGRNARFPKPEADPPVIGDLQPHVACPVAVGPLDVEGEKQRGPRPVGKDGSLRQGTDRRHSVRKFAPERKTSVPAALMLDRFDERTFSCFHGQYIFDIEPICNRKRGDVDK